jgi:hypothetical protein
MPSYVTHGSGQCLWEMFSVEQRELICSAFEDYVLWKNVAKNIL